MEARDQIDIAKRLQEKLLLRFEKLLDKGELSPTDAATLARLLSQNGWNFDESSLPQNLRDKLTKKIDPKELDLDDLVIGRIA